VLFGLFGRRAAVTHVRVANVADLAQRIVQGVGHTTTTCVDVHVLNAKPPRGWWGSPEIRSVVNLSCARDSEGVHVRLQVEKPMDLSALLAAVLRIIEPVRMVNGTFVDSLPPDATSLACAIRDVYSNDTHTHLRRADVLFSSRDVPDVEAQHRIVISDGGQWNIDGHPNECVIDPAIHRPLGRPSDAPLVRVAAPTASWLTARDVNALRGASVIDGHVSPIVRTQLHASGLLLSDELPASQNVWDIAAAALHHRRMAYQASSPLAVLNRWPSVSVVLLTHRLTHMPAILQQLREIQYPHLQVLIGLHGIDAGDIATQIADFPHHVDVHHCDGELPFGAAMQELSMKADGQFITKVDDDDRYSPTHIWDLVIAASYSGAELVGKALDWIYVEEENLTVFRPTYRAEKYGKFVAGGTLFIAREVLGAVGGWRPVPRSIDLGLIESVRSHGGVVYRTQGLGYTYVRRSSGHTARVNNAHFRTQVTAEFPGDFQVST
jgi:hypothetical protein